jgi:hypothetical protein
MIVSPTKVGYIIMTTDGGGLNRKFTDPFICFRKCNQSLRTDI